MIETALETVEKTKNWMKTAWGIDAPLEPIISAIKSLEQEDVINKIRAEIVNLDYLVIEDGSDGYDNYVDLYEVLHIIDKYRNGGAE